MIQINRKDIVHKNKLCDLEVVKLELSDLNFIKVFILKEYENIQQKDFFIIDDIDTELPMILNNNGIVYGVLHNNEIVAIQAIDFSIENNNHLKPYLAKYISGVNYVEMGWTMTKSSYQHKSIASSLIKLLEEAVSDKLEKSILVTTVHPRNLKALKTYLHNGYLGYTLERYYGLPRIFMLKISNKIYKKELAFKIEASNYEEIKKAFKDGFVLFDIVQEEQIDYFVYQKMTICR